MHRAYGEAAASGAVGVDESAERVLVTAAEGRDERGLAAQGLGTEHPLRNYTLAPA
jgi:hypothetical protein